MGHEKRSTRSGLAGVLSDEAAALYEQLIETGGLSLTQHPDCSRSVAGRELIDKGFARERHVGTSMFVPVEPTRALDNAILVMQRQILEQHQMLLRLRDEMQALQQTYLSRAQSSEEPQGLIRLLTNRAEIGGLSVELCLSAEHDVASIETEHFTRPPDPRSARTLPAEVLERGVRFRNIYSRAALEIPGAQTMLRLSMDAGWECRVHEQLPMKMVLVDDRAALLPLDPTGMEGAVLVRAPVVVAALRMYFELLWTRAVPLNGNPAELSHDQDQVLRLVLTGMTDAAIARHLGISERTVRRHVGVLLERLQAKNRVTLAATAVREGWVP
jgi:DNA-binding CsgD family transcriptional regulator